MRKENGCWLDEMYAEQEAQGPSTRIPLNPTSFLQSMRC